MLCISRAPLAELSDYKRRMGWSFQWVSSLRNDFNYDSGVSLPANRDSDSAVYNFKTPWGIAEEHAGLSAFALEDGLVYHTYSFVLCARPGGVQRHLPTARPCSRRPQRGAASDAKDLAPAPRPI